jgi:FAD/FMN-containing dehydrogenase
MTKTDNNGPAAHAVAPGEATRRPTRRDLITGTAKVAALGALMKWTPAFKIRAASAQSTCTVPPGFPGGIDLYQEAYENWSGEIAISALWTCAPTTPAEVVTICNWAFGAGYKVRPRGEMHNWSPLTVAATETCANQVVLLDTTQYLTAVSITAGSPSTVTAQTGITMLALLTALENEGLGLTANPAPGDLTLGGVLAIDGHGTAIPAVGETLLAGHTYGSVSNLILSVTAVVWDAATESYGLQTFARNNPAIQPLLAHVGRSFITSVTLQVGANQRLQCQSWINVAASTLFAPAGSSGKTMTSYLNACGRVEAIWFPFTANPWLKVWTVAPSQPFLSVEVNSPFNYPFSDQISSAELELVTAIQTGDPASVTLLGPLQYDIVSAGLVAEFVWDIWGWSKNVTLYVRPTTLKVTANGYAVLTSRANIQQVINDFYVFFLAQQAAYKAQGLYPMNGPVEIRITGLDQPSDVKMAGALPPQLSALTPRPDQPGWNVAVWFDILTLPGTPAAAEFYRTIEQWMIGHYTGSYAAVRPEWSKGWAYTNTAGWSDPTVLGTTIPNAYRAGQAAGDKWDSALAALDSYDPHRLFSAPIHNVLMP